MRFTLLRRILVIAAVLGIFGVNAFAVDACTSATADVYFASGFSCFIGDKLFSNFAVNMGSAYTVVPDGIGGYTMTPLSLSQINVIPTSSGGPTPASVTLTLDMLNVGDPTTGSPLAVTAGAAATLEFQYMVTAATGYHITSVSGWGIGAYQDAPYLWAGITGQKDYCQGQAYLTDPDSGNPTGICAGANGNVYLDYIQPVFSPITPMDPLITDSYVNMDVMGYGTYVPNTSSVGIYEIFALDGGAYGGYLPNQVTAALWQVGNTITEMQDYTPPGGVPEPSTYLMLGAGLLGLGILRRKHA